MRWIPVCSKRYFCYLPYLLDRGRFIIWGAFFLVAVGTMAALTFGSDIWFGRPLNITGPYQLANIAVQFYLPLLTIIIPITISSFSRILLKCRKGHEDD